MSEKKYHSFTIKVKEVRTYKISFEEAMTEDEAKDAFWSDEAFDIVDEETYELLEVEQVTGNE